MGLRWAICKRLSSRSFDYLFDIVLAAAASEKLVEREKTMKWKPHSLQHTCNSEIFFNSLQFKGKYFNSFIEGFW